MGTDCGLHVHVYIPRRKRWLVVYSHGQRRPCWSCLRQFQFPVWQHVDDSSKNHSSSGNAKVEYHCPILREDRNPVVFDPFNEKEYDQMDSFCSEQRNQKCPNEFCSDTYYYGDAMFANETEEDKKLSGFFDLSLAPAGVSIWGIPLQEGDDSLYDVMERAKEEIIRAGEHQQNHLPECVRDCQCNTAWTHFVVIQIAKVLRYVPPCDIEPNLFFNRGQWDVSFNDVEDLVADVETWHKLSEECTLERRKATRTACLNVLFRQVFPSGELASNLVSIVEEYLGPPKGNQIRLHRGAM